MIVPGDELKKNFDKVRSRFLRENGTLRPEVEVLYVDEHGSCLRLGPVRLTMFADGREPVCEIEPIL